VTSRRIGRSLRIGLTALSATAAVGCGASPITSLRIETDIAQTFANLVHLQVDRLGLPSITPSELAAKATCRRVTAGNSSGSGDWVCTINWQGPERRRFRDTYDLFVGTDGCYTATVEGSSLGGPVLKAPDGSDVRNLLFAFDGCFDLSAR
jgi:hypothetical protein